MSDFCAYHPDREARGICSECGFGYCSECRRSVLGRQVCWKCAHLLSQVDTSTTSLSKTSPVPARTAFESDHATTSTRLAANDSSLQYTLGLAAGLVTAVVGTVVLEQIIFLTHFYMLGLVSIAIGYAVGGVVERFGKRGGLAQALPAVLMVVVAQLYGYALLANDLFHKHTHGMLHRTHVVAFHALPPIVLPIGFTSLIGSVILCYRAAMGESSETGL